MEMIADFCSIYCLTAHRCSNAAAWNNSVPANRSQGREWRA